MERRRSTSPVPIFNSKYLISQTPASKINRHSQNSSMTQTQPDPYYFNLSRKNGSDRMSDYRSLKSPMRTNKPRFRTRNTSNAEVTELNSEESSEDIRSCMKDLKKSPKRTGNFAMAYRSGSTTVSGNLAQAQHFHDHGSNDVQRVSKKLKLENQFPRSNVQPTLSSKIKSEILDDWEVATDDPGCGNEKTTCPRDFSLTAKSSSPGGMIRSLTDSKSTTVNTDRNASAETQNCTENLEQSLFQNSGDEDDDASNASQVTLPPCEDSKSIQAEILTEDLVIIENNENSFKEIPDPDATAVSKSALSRNKPFNRYSGEIKEQPLPANRISNAHRSQKTDRENSKVITFNETFTVEKKSEGPRSQQTNQGRLRSEHSEQDRKARFQNVQLSKNMENMYLPTYMKWLWRTYQDQFARSSSVDILPLLEKILKQPEVHCMMNTKVQQIRENIYLMENKTTPQLFSMVSEIIKKILESDLEDTIKVYHATLNLFSYD